MALSAITLAQTTGAFAGDQAAQGPGLQPDQHCVVSIDSSDTTCFDTFREAVSVASDGEVTDAPIDAAPLTAAQTEKINEAGEELDASGRAATPGATAAGDAVVDDGTKPETMGAGASSEGESAAAPPSTTATATPDNPNLGAGGTIIEIAYEHRDYRGSSITFRGRRCNVWDKNEWQGVRDLPRYGWNDTMSSFKTFNDCASLHFEHANFDWANGDYLTDWSTIQKPYVGNKFNDKISSIRWHFNGPSPQELMNICEQGKTTCVFHPTGRSNYATAFQGVKEAINCSSIQQRDQIQWSETTSGSLTAGGKITVGAKVSEVFQLGFEANYSQTWSWQKTYGETQWIDVPPGKIATLELSTKMEVVNGYYELRFGSPRDGHYIWYVHNFRGTGPVTNDLGVTRWRERTATQADCRAGTPAPSGLRMRSL